VTGYAGWKISACCLVCYSFGKRKETSTAGEADSGSKWKLLTAFGQIYDDDEDGE